MFHKVMSNIPNERPEHAPSPAGASVDPNQAVEPTATSENSAAGDGCRVSSCSLSSILRDAWGRFKWVHPEKAEVVDRMNQNRRKIEYQANELRRARLHAPGQGSPSSAG